MYNFEEIKTVDQVIELVTDIANKFDLSNDNIYDSLESTLMEENNITGRVVGFILEAAEIIDTDDFKINCLWVLDELDRFYKRIPENTVSLRADAIVTKAAIENLVNKDGNFSIRDMFIADCIMVVRGYAGKDMIRIYKDLDRNDVTGALLIQYDYENDPIETSYDGLVEAAKNCLIRMNLSTLR